MSKKSILPQRRRSVFLYDEDWLWLERWSNADQNRPTPSLVVREMLHRRVQAAKAKQVEALDQRLSRPTSNASHPDID